MPVDTIHQMMPSCPERILKRLGKKRADQMVDRRSVIEWWFSRIWGNTWCVRIRSSNQATSRENQAVFFYTAGKCYILEIRHDPGGGPWYLSIYPPLSPPSNCPPPLVFRIRDFWIPGGERNWRWGPPQAKILGVFWALLRGETIQKRSRSDLRLTPLPSPNWRISGSWLSPPLFSENLARRGGTVVGICPDSKLSLLSINKNSLVKTRKMA